MYVHTSAGNNLLLAKHICHHASSILRHVFILLHHAISLVSLAACRSSASATADMLLLLHSDSSLMPTLGVASESQQMTNLYKHLASTKPPDYCHPNVYHWLSTSRNSPDFSLSLMQVPSRLGCPPCSCPTTEQPCTFWGSWRGYAPPGLPFRYRG